MISSAPRVLLVIHRYLMTVNLLTDVYPIHLNLLHGKYNQEMRKQIIMKINQDIWFLTETHFPDEISISIDDFNWIGQNRKGSKKSSDGIGFLLYLIIYINCI